MYPSGEAISEQLISVGGVIYERTLSDSADVADQQQAYEEKLRLLLSTVTIDDLLIRTLQVFGATLERTLSSNINVNDTVNRDAILNRLLGSELNVEDTLQSFIGVVLTRILSSNLELSDAIRTEKEIERLLTESIIVLDNVLQDKNLLRLLNDNAELVDIIARTVALAPQTYNRVLSDSLEIQDLIIRETTGQLIQLILSRLVNAYDIEIGIETMNINIDSEDV